MHVKEIEIEFKNLLNQEEFERLLKYFPFSDQPVIQTNYYFDTKSRTLAKHRHALRIRQKNQHFRLTLKQPQGDHILETHDILTQSEAESWIKGHIIPKPNITAQLEKLHIQPTDLFCYGKLVTKRYSYEIEDITLVLDCSKYNGKMDYELEVEAQDHHQGLAFFNQLLREHQIKKRLTPNKIERFFASL